MRLTLMEFLTLDGVSQGPGAPDEDTSDDFTQGGWFVPHLDEEFVQLVANWINEADAFLFGEVRNLRGERVGARKPSTANHGHRSVGGELDVGT